MLVPKPQEHWTIDGASKWHGALPPKRSVKPPYSRSTTETPCNSLSTRDSPVYASGKLAWFGASSSDLSLFCRAPLRELTGFFMWIFDQEFLHSSANLVGARLIKSFSISSHARSQFDQDQHRLASCASLDVSSHSAGLLTSKTSSTVSQHLRLHNVQGCGSRRQMMVRRGGGTIFRPLFSTRIRSVKWTSHAVHEHTSFITATSM